MGSELGSSIAIASEASSGVVVFFPADVEGPAFRVCSDSDGSRIGAAGIRRVVLQLMQV